MIPLMTLGLRAGVGSTGSVVEASTFRGGKGTGDSVSIDWWKSCYHEHRSDDAAGMMILLRRPVWCEGEPTPSLRRRLGASKGFKNT